MSVIQERGTSLQAGRQGVLRTALTRCLLVPCACLMLPPLGLSMLSRVNLLPRNSAGVAYKAVQLGLIYLSLQAALPAALAVFPQVRLHYH